MSYRKAAEKNGWREWPSAASRPADDDAGTPPSAPGNTSVPSPEAAADDSETPGTPGNTEGADDNSGLGSGLMLTLETARMNLGDVLLPAVQVGTLLDEDCQSGADDDSCEGDAIGVVVSLEVDAGLDTNGLALVRQDLSDLPVLPGLIAADCDDGTGDAACDNSTGGADAEGATSVQADISIEASLDLGEGACTDALSLLLKGTPLLGGPPESDGLLGGVLGGCGDVEQGEGMPVVPQLLPAIDGVLDGLIASTDLLQVFDGGGCSA